MSQRLLWRCGGHQTTPLRSEWPFLHRPCTESQGRVERALVAHLQQRPRLPEVQGRYPRAWSSRPSPCSPALHHQEGHVPLRSSPSSPFPQTGGVERPTLLAPCVPTSQASRRRTRYRRPFVARGFPAVEHHQRQTLHHRLLSQGIVSKGERVLPYAPRVYRIMDETWVARSYGTAGGGDG